MFVIKAMLAFASKNMGSHMRYVLIGSLELRLKNGKQTLTPNATGANLWLSPIGSGSTPSALACSE